MMSSRPPGATRKTPRPLVTISSGPQEGCCSDVPPRQLYRYGIQSWAQSRSREQLLQRATLLTSFNELKGLKRSRILVQQFVITSRHLIHHPCLPDASLQSPKQRYLLTARPKPTITSEPIVYTTNSVRQILPSHRVQARSRTSVNLFAVDFSRDAGPSSRNLYRSSALSPGILPFLFPFTMSMLSVFQDPSL